MSEAPTSTHFTATGDLRHPMSSSSVYSTIYWGNKGGIANGSTVTSLNLVSGGNGWAATEAYVSSDYLTFSMTMEYTSPTSDGLADLKLANIINSASNAFSMSHF